jgi:hypothetical protein
MESLALICGHLVGDYVLQNDWMAANKTSRSWPCAVHCAMYSLAVFLCAGFLVSWHVPILAGVIHFPVDRWRLARKFMTFNGQEAFATGLLAPWSVVVVDNTIHLVTLLVLAVLFS